MITNNQLSNLKIKFTFFCLKTILDIFWKMIKNKFTFLIYLCIKNDNFLTFVQLFRLKTFSNIIIQL
jgi:hypothetical protein